MIIRAYKNSRPHYTHYKIRVQILKNIFKQFVMADFGKVNKQKQPSRGVLGKRSSENMQHIYRKTSMLKCDFNKVALQPH